MRMITRCICVFCLLAVVAGTAPGNPKDSDTNKRTVSTDKNPESSLKQNMFPHSKQSDPMAARDGVQSPKYSQDYYLPVWKRLENFSLPERKNASIHLEMPGDLPGFALKAAGDIEVLWNQGNYAKAIRNLRKLEQTENLKNIAVGISWNIPMETQAPLWDTDVKISDRNQLTKVCLDFDEATGHLFAALKWYDNFSVNISKDGGQTWQETYEWLAASFLLPDIEATVFNGYFYVAHIAYYTHDQARLRRFNAADGASDGTYSFQTVFEKGIQISDVSLAANVDTDNNRIFFLAIMADNSLEAYWSDNNALVWHEDATGITNVSRGLDACWNVNYAYNFLFVSFIDINNKLHIARRNQNSWIDNEFGDQLTSTNQYTAIAAYKDTVITVFEYTFPNNSPGIAYYHSGNGGTNWNNGNIANPFPGEVFYGPDVTARKGGGIAVVYTEEAGVFDRCWYTHAGYAADNWSVPEKFSETDPNTTFKLETEWIPPNFETGHSYGAIWIEGADNYAYFDRLDDFSGPQATMIHVTAPNGGEVWFVGNYHSITWETDRKVGEVMVQISTTGGDSWWDVTRGRYTANDGQYTYKPVVQNISGHCLFRVRLIGDLTIGDQSNNELTIIDSSMVKRYIAAHIPNGMTSPIIDGDLTDAVWSGANPGQYLQVGGVPDDFLMPWSNFPDNQVTWKALWSTSSNLLYLAIEVKDDIAGAVDNDFDHLYQDDCIELFSDGDNHGGNYGGTNMKAQQWFIRSDNTKHLAALEGEYTGSAITSAVQHGTDGNWTLELAMVILDNFPNDIRVLALEDIIGWDIWYDDSDNTHQDDGKWARDHQVGWGYIGRAWQNADSFQELELGPAATVPVLTVIPTTLDFGKTATGLDFTISNIGSGSLNWSVSENPEKSWITSITPGSGSGETTVTVTVDRSQLSGTTDSGMLTVTSNGGNRDITVLIAKTTGNPPAHWDFSGETGNNATVILLTSANPNIDGTPLANGDYVGVFTSAGLCCGHAQWQTEQNMSIPVWGDNDQTGEVDGFKAGELLKYRVFRISDASELSAVEVGYLEGTGYYSVNAVMTINKFNVSESGVLTLNLNQGWNMLSINVNPFNPDVEAVMAPIVDQLTIMKNGRGETYIPEYGINNIGDINFKEGYQAYLKAAIALNVNGQELDPTTPIELAAGWSMISYLPKAAIDAEIALAGITGVLKLAKNNAGQTYIPEYEINTIGQMQTGQGYQVYLTAAATLIYPAGGSSNIARTSEICNASTPTYFQIPDITAGNATIVIPFEIEPRYSNGASLEKGDEIGAFTPEGLCCGAVVWDGRNNAITVWGDNSQTEQLDGFQTGQALQFKIWKKDSDEEFAAQVDCRENPAAVFQTNGFFVLKKLVAMPDASEITEIHDSAIPSDFTLLRNYPNPFNPETTIEYHLPHSSEVTLTIYDLKGHTVNCLVHATNSAGCHTIRWNGRDQTGLPVASGMYFYKIEARPTNPAQACFVAVKKMILMK